MPSTRRINTAFREYYALLDSYAEKGAGTESTTELAMKRLLGDWCSMYGDWTLIKASVPLIGGGYVIPDGIIVDDKNIRRGFWEAKDTDDDLKTEIEKKRLAGYPFEKNLLFDDTVTAVLFQNDARLGDCLVRDRECFERMLGDFFAWSNPPIDDLHAAMDRFTDDLPLFAKRLHELIAEAKRKNKKFVEQLDRFYDMCRQSLNPSVTPAQIEEMLAQHLLTERIARRVFRYDRFRETNAVARELENLVDAFLGDAPSRDRHMAGLDHYFHAVETYAELVQDFSEKQDFLTKVYEPFLNVYSPKDADRLGIVYTPQPIVRFIVNSVEAALNEHFGKSLADKGVHILDPCTGTGNFIVEVLKKIKALRPSALEYKYKNELWANEILLLPYYIAGLNIEAAYHAHTGTHREFPGVCFTDTLLLNTIEAQPLLEGFSPANAERVHKQEKADITVIIGNPPYNKLQAEENQDAKNLYHPGIYKRIKNTYAKDSNATLLNALYDPYIQFIRWATDRIGDEGVVCFVTNNYFLNGFAADGMRKHLLADYTEIYHFDLGGNARIGESGNVFGIMVGVGITLLIKSKGQQAGSVRYFKVEASTSSEERLSLLTLSDNYQKVEFNELQPTHEGREWFAPDNDFEEHYLLGDKKEKRKEIKEATTIFHTYSLGVSTNRDAVVYDFDDWRLEQRIRAMIEAYNLEIDRWKRSGRPKGRELDAFVDTEKVNWSSTLKMHLQRERYAAFSEKEIRTSLYRPYSKRFLFFDPIFIDRRLKFPHIFPTPTTEEENRVICLSGEGSRSLNKTVLVSKRIVNLNFVTVDPIQCFPLYVYDTDGSNRRLNVTPWGVKLFRTRYGLKGDFYDPKADADDPAFGPVTPWKIFHYTYALLHAKGYREKYERNLKKSLPRIPLLGNNRTFVRMAELGEELATQHLTYETAKPYKLERIEKSTKGAEFDWACPKLRLDKKDRTVVRYNDVLTLTGVPPEALEYKLGNRSAVEWVLNQYRKFPARDDFVIKLIERVITVSLGTVEKTREINKIWDTHTK